MLVVQTPLRVSLFGGGTDFPHYYERNGGCVLSTAINKYIYVVINPRIDNKIRVSCTHIQRVNHIRNIKHDLIREAVKLTNMCMGVEIITIGDIPAGTGLGSSSTVTVGLLKAMHTYMGTPNDPEEIAKEACTIELDILKKPGGIQDQYIASYGGFRFIEFTKDKISVSTNILGCRDLESRLMLFFTGVSRESSSILSDQAKRDNDSLLDRLKELAYWGMTELTRKNYDAFGKLLHESWKVKRKVASGVTNKKIDNYYKLAIDAGALGGKITGAGGGGFLLIYTPLEKRESVKRSLKDLKEIPFHFESSGSKVIYDK